MGMELTHRLIDEARDNGVRYLYGLVMRENRRITRFEVCLQAE